MPKSDPSLYPIVDFGFCRQHAILPVDLARLALEGSPRWLQLRAKDTPSDEFLEVIDALVGPAREASVEIVVNDRPDLAELAGAPSVHVGQGDLGPSEIRRFAPRLRVGVSTHSLDQLERALAERPDYVAFGPIFATASKERADAVVGLEQLRVAHAVARRARVPLVAIGGIDSDRLHDVAPYCEGVSVISALFEQGPLLEDVARQLVRLSDLCRR